MAEDKAFWQPIHFRIPPMIVLRISGAVVGGSLGFELSLITRAVPEIG